MKLREALEKKIHQVSIADENIAEVVENFRWKKEELTNMINNQKNEAHDKIQTMKEKIVKIKLEISGMSLFKHESDLLNSRLKELCTEQRQNQELQRKDLDKKKQTNFDLRMAMDEIMRKVIKSSDEDYLNEAVSINIYINSFIVLLLLLSSIIMIIIIIIGIFFMYFYYLILILLIKLLLHLFNREERWR